MSDVETRQAERRWREEQTVEAARAYVSVLARSGSVEPGLRAAVDAGDRGAAERLFVEALRRDSPDDVRASLATLDGTPGRDRDAPRFWQGVVISRPGEPCGLQWSPPADSPGERFVVGWLRTLSLAEQVDLWTHDLLGEPVVADEERDRVFRRAMGTEVTRTAWNVVANVTWAVCYMSDRFLVGGPPAIERTFRRLAHGILRRALALDLRDRESEAALRVVRAILESETCGQPTACVIRLAAAQPFDHRLTPENERFAAGEIEDDYALMGALSLFCRSPWPLVDARAVERMLGVPSAGFALAHHLGAALERIPRALALALLSRARDGTTSWDAGALGALVETLLFRAEAFEGGLRDPAEATLLAMAARGEAPHAFVGVLDPALRPGAAWEEWKIPRRFHPRPSRVPGPWLRTLAPELVRRIARSNARWARAHLAEMWETDDPQKYPGLEDVYRDLAADLDPNVRFALRSGPPLP